MKRRESTDSKSAGKCTIAVRNTVRVGDACGYSPVQRFEVGSSADPCRPTVLRAIVATPPEVRVCPSRGSGPRCVRDDLFHVKQIRRTHEPQPVQSSPLPEEHCMATCSWLLDRQSSSHVESVATWTPEVWAGLQRQMLGSPRHQLGLVTTRTSCRQYEQESIDLPTTDIVGRTSARAHADQRAITPSGCRDNDEAPRMADGGATRSPCGSNDPSAGEQQHFMGRKRRSLVIGTGVRSRVRSRLAFVTSTTHECGIQSWRCFVARWWPVIGIQSRLARGRGVEGRSLRVGDVSHVDRPVAATEPTALAAH